MDTRQLLAFVFGILGNAISVLVYLAPVTTFYRIWKRKSTEGFQCLPYLVALFSSMLWLFYAFLKGHATLLITINSFGCFVESLYIIIFVIYANRSARKLTIKLFAALDVAAFLALVLFTMFTTKGQMRVRVFGWICVTISVCVFAAPLSIVVKVHRTRSVEYMPIYLSVFLTLSAVMWFAYGYSVNDMCVAVPNILGLLLGITQIGVYVAYKNAKKVAVTEEETKPEDVKEIVVLGLQGRPSEVYPFEIQPSDDRSGNGFVEKQEQSARDGKKSEDARNATEKDLEKDAQAADDLPA